MSPEQANDINEAYWLGQSEGYKKGREAAANSLTDLANLVGSRYVKSEWRYMDDGHTQDVLDIWLSAPHAVSIARGEW
jgi:hypothetical protein